MPVPEWPAPDRAAWIAALQPDGPPDLSAIAAHWSEATRRIVRSAYGRWLTWLAEQGLLDATTPPAERITTERLSSYVAALRTSVGAFTVVMRVEHLGNAMHAMAPQGHWHWLQRLAAQIRAGAKAERQQALPAAPAGDAEAPVAASGAMPPNRCMPLAEWPATDQSAWNATLQPGDVLDPGGIAAGWAAATRTIVISGYGRWLTWLAGRDLLDPRLPPASRVTRQRLRDYAEDLRSTVAPFTVAARLEQIGNAMRAMAPEADWHWIQRAADRLRARAVPARDKRARLRSPAQLLALGMQLMAAAEIAVDDLPVARAKRHRDGLLIALLALRPMRGRNLAAIACGQHLLRRGAAWWLLFPAAATKTHRALEFPVPPELAPHLERYMAAYRPVLLARGCHQNQPSVTGLWVSAQGTQMGYAAIGYQVRQRTRAAFGVALSPHLFRDCAATEIAISAPDQVRLIMPILGHTTLKTSERYYNLAGSLEAGRRYARTIADLRRLNARHVCTHQP
jgi:integrase